MMAPAHTHATRTRTSDARSSMPARATRAPVQHAHTHTTVMLSCHHHHHHHRLEYCLPCSQDDLLPLLHSEATRDAETNAFIVERIKAALAVNKACATEQQRREWDADIAQA